MKISVISTAMPVMHLPSVSYETSLRVFHSTLRKHRIESRQFHLNRHQLLRQKHTHTHVRVLAWRECNDRMAITRKYARCALGLGVSSVFARARACTRNARTGSVPCSSDRCRLSSSSSSRGSDCCWKVKFSVAMANGLVSLVCQRCVLLALAKPRENTALCVHLMGWRTVIRLPVCPPRRAAPAVPSVLRVRESGKFSYLLATRVDSSEAHTVYVGQLRVSSEMNNRASRSLVCKCATTTTKYIHVNKHLNGFTYTNTPRNKNTHALHSFVHKQIVRMVGTGSIRSRLL